MRRDASRGVVSRRERRRMAPTWKCRGRVYDWRRNRQSARQRKLVGDCDVRRDAAQSLEFGFVSVSTPRASVVVVVGNVDGVRIVEIEPLLVVEDVVGVAV